MALRFSIGGNRYHFTFKFVGLSFLLVVLFSSLGFWQISRAEQKRLLIAAYAKRPEEAPIRFAKLFEATEDARYYTIRLKGHFDNQHQILLDNKTLNGQVGYEVYTPLKVQGSAKAILIDRGWVPADRDRSRLPTLKPLSSPLSLTGVVNKPPAYFALGEMRESQKDVFPLRVQYIDLKALTEILGYPLAPYIVWLDPKDPLGFERQWKVTFMGPEKHLMYAVQWFAFALCLLVLFGALNLHRIEEP